MNPRLFESEVWTPALEKYAGVTHVSVSLYDVNAKVVCGPIHPTPLSELFGSSRFGADLVAECRHGCLGSSDRHVVFTTRLGLAVVGAPLTLNGEIAGALIAGYHVIEFPHTLALQRLALDAALPLARVWDVMRQQTPVSKTRCLAHGELLQVLGDAVLNATYRTRRQAELSAR